MSKKNIKNAIVDCLTTSAEVLGLTQNSSEAAVPPTTAPESSESAEQIVAARSSDTAEPDSESFVVDNADGAIKRGGQKFYDYYAAYKNIRELARPLNGLPQSAPFPAAVSINKITVEFTVNGLARSIEIPEPAKVGDIAPLVSFAIRDIIEKMNNELHILSYLVSGMHTAVQNAFNSRVMAPPPGQYDNTNTKQ
jgi:hypothetical protein